MSALLSGGALIRVWLPSSPIRVTPWPWVSPRLPLTMRHWPVRAGLRLQVISAAEAATGNNNITASTALITAHFLQTSSRGLGQSRDGQQGNRDSRQHPLDRGTVIAEPVIQPAFQGQGNGAAADLGHIAQRPDGGAVARRHDLQRKAGDQGIGGKEA